MGDAPKSQAAAARATIRLAALALLGPAPRRDAPICCSPCQPPGYPAPRARSVSRPLAAQCHATPAWCRAAASTRPDRPSQLTHTSRAVHARTQGSIPVDQPAGSRGQGVGPDRCPARQLARLQDWHRHLDRRDHRRRHLERALCPERGGRHPRLLCHLPRLRLVPRPRAVPRVGRRPDPGSHFPLTPPSLAETRSLTDSQPPTCPCADQ